MKFYVYLLKCKNDIYYVGKGQVHRVLSSAEEKHALSFQLWYVSSNEKARKLEDKIWKNMTERGYKLLNVNKPRAVPRHITFHNRTQTIEEWSEELGIKVKTLYQRLRLGWGIKDALTREHRKVEVKKLACNGETKTVKEWAAELGVSKTYIRSRLRRGLGVEGALVKPTDVRFCTLTYNGETKTIKEWSKIMKISVNTVKSRLRRGYSVEEALMTRLWGLQCSIK